MKLITIVTMMVLISATAEARMSSKKHAEYLDHAKTLAICEKESGKEKRNGLKNNDYDKDLKKKRKRCYKGREESQKLKIKNL